MERPPAPPVASSCVVRVVIARRPAWIEALVQLLRLTRHFVVLGLFGAGEFMPLLPEDLVDCRGLLEGALLLDAWSHLLHEEHKGVEGFLDVRLLEAGE